MKNSRYLPPGQAARELRIPEKEIWERIRKGLVDHKIDDLGYLKVDVDELKRKKRRERLI